LNIRPAKQYLNNAVVLLKFVFFYSHSCVRCVFYDEIPPSARCISFPQSGQLSRYLLASLLSLVVVAFADQIWTPTRAVASVHVSATFA